MDGRIRAKKVRSREEVFVEQVEHVAEEKKSRLDPGQNDQEEEEKMDEGIKAMCRLCYICKFLCI